MFRSDSSERKIQTNESKYDIYVTERTKEVPSLPKGKDRKDVTASPSEE